MRLYAVPMKHKVLPVLVIMLLTQILSCNKQGNDDIGFLGRDASYAFGVYIGSDLAVTGNIAELDEIIQAMKDVISGAKTRFSLEEALTLVDNIDSSFGEYFSSKDMSYAFGISMGSYLVQRGVTPDMKQVSKGLKSSFSGKKTRFNLEEARVIFGQAVYNITENIKNENQRKENDFFAEILKKPGLITTSSGLLYEVITEGNGMQPQADDKVRVNYKVWLPDGTLSESSQDEPAEFTVDMLLPGWVQAIQLMREGGKYIFYIPSELSVRPEDADGTINYTTPVTFEAELLEILK